MTFRYDLELDQYIIKYISTYTRWAQARMLAYAAAMEIHKQLYKIIQGLRYMEFTY